MGETAKKVVSRVSSLRRAQTVDWASNRQGVRTRSSAARPGRATVNRIPKSYFVVRSTGIDWGDVTRTHLIFLFPVQDIIDFAQSADIDVFTRPHEHF